MGKVGCADLPLHGGNAPRWLFDRMVALSHGIVGAIVEERGTDDLLRKLSDPFWFQALSCVIGFDWHSSGTTTVTCGALKEATKGGELGVSVAGGKGSRSRMAPQDIIAVASDFGLAGERVERLVYLSKMSAKVDSAAVQDGHQLYHHAFIFTDVGHWAVVQQGMSPETRYARRYHWLHEELESLVVEPHSSIIGNRSSSVLDMTAARSEESRKASVDLVRENPRKLRNSLTTATDVTQSTLDRWTGEKRRALWLPSDLDWELASRLYEFQPSDYEELLAFRGVGPATVRALALVAELVYGAEPSWQDPVKYSFAVGGKDGVPYPVDRKAMDETTEIVEKGVRDARVGNRERLNALRRLREVIPPRLR